jgi:hypothetical protein
LDEARLEVVEWRTMQRAHRNIGGWTLYDGTSYYWMLPGQVKLAAREQEDVKPEETGEKRLSLVDSKASFTKGYNDYKQGISLGDSILSSPIDTPEYTNRIRIGWQSAKNLPD